jgi:ParB/RepB/Spo0J family partition protein
MSTELGELRIVKVEEIIVDPAKNPRGEITKEEIAELVASVRENGVTQPVLCTDGEEGLELVAGYRRVAACREAKVAEIPVYVRDSERRDTYALTENLPGLRKDMSPIAEARAMKRIATASGLNQKMLAKRLGKSPGFVAERLRMLRLPEAVQNVLASGRPGISAVPQLEKIAKVSEAAAIRVAQLAASDEEIERLLRTNPERVLSRLERLLAEERGTVEVEEGRSLPRPPAEGELVVLEVGGYQGVDLDELALSEERREEFATRIAALEERERDPHGHGEELSVELGEHDLDALRALGVLLEYEDEDRYFASRFCFDSVAVLDRIELVLSEAEAEAKTHREAQLKEARTEAKAGGKELSEDADPAKILAEKKKEERADELKEDKEKRATARRLNLDLGRRLLKRRARKRTEKRRRELTRALALLAVSAEEHLAGLGPRLIYETWQEVEQKRLKSGKLGAEKITYLEPREACERLRAEIAAAKSLDDILDVIGDALVGAVYGSEEELAMSRRVCGYVGRLHHGTSGPVRRAIDEEAKGVLPPELCEELKRSRERGYEEPTFVG